MQLHCVTNEEPSPYYDKFFEVQQMQEWWNNCYATENSPSYYNCLDESMNSWLNEYCPRWMCVPCKLHPFGNEYYTIANGDDGIAMVWQVVLLEGKE